MVQLDRAPKVWPGCARWAVASLLALAAVAAPPRRRAMNC